MERSFSLDNCYYLASSFLEGEEMTVELTNGVETEHGYSLPEFNRCNSVYQFQEFLQISESTGNESFPIVNGVLCNNGSEVDEACQVLEGISRPRKEPERNGCGTNTSGSSPAEDPFQDSEIALNPMFSRLQGELTGNDPEEINLRLKAKLAEDCKRAAASREGTLRLPEFVQDLSLNVGLHHANGATISGSEALKTGTAAGGLTGTQVTSGSSQDPSDEDDLDNENNVEPGDDKLVKRKLSNRESARRSRRRKQEQADELKRTTENLQAENATLKKRLLTAEAQLDVSSRYHVQLKDKVAALQHQLQAALGVYFSGSALVPPPFMSQVNTQHRGMEQPFRVTRPSFVSHMNRQDRGMEQQPIAPQEHFAPSSMTATDLPQMNTQHRRMGQPLEQQQPHHGTKMPRTPSMQRIEVELAKKRLRNIVGHCDSAMTGASSMMSQGPSMIAAPSRMSTGPSMTVAPSKMSQGPAMMAVPSMMAAPTQRPQGPSMVPHFASYSGR